MNELNEFMATEVMGYIVDSANWLDYYGDSKTNEFIIAVDEWKPTEDLNQAMMCAENSKVNVSLSCSRTKDGDLVGLAANAPSKPRKFGVSAA